jgi:hypothetical protein
MTERRDFEYLLNAMESATQAECPADAGYAAKRKAVFEYVIKLEAAQSAPAPLPATQRSKPMKRKWSQKKYEAAAGNPFLPWFDDEEKT